MGCQPRRSRPDRLYWLLLSFMPEAGTQHLFGRIGLSRFDPPGLQETKAIRVLRTHSWKNQGLN